MSERAHITSIEAIEQFRSQLIIYISKARPALEEVSGDITRLRGWLENDQRLLWEGHFRRRAKDLEEAQSALFSARIGMLRKESSLEIMVAQRCKRSLEEADQKLRVIKRWDRDFEARVQPLVKQIEKLQSVLSLDLVNAVAYLGEVIRTLQDYAGAGPRLESTSPSPPNPELASPPPGISEKPQP